MRKENADGRGDNGWNPPEKTGSGLQDQAEGAGLYEKKGCRKVRSWRCGARSWGAPVS